MQISIEDTNLILLILGLLVSYVLFQLYMVFKIKEIVQRILEIFIKIDKMVREFQSQKPGKRSGAVRTCQNCKNRVVYYHSEDENYFYIKCRLNNQIVSPEDFCHQFVFDPQNYEI